MNLCPSCKEPIGESSRICPTCGATISRATTPPNVTQTQPAYREGAARGKPAEVGADRWASRSGDHGRFLPGAMLTQRYRIVSLLGKGGMGEVYRADDLELDHPVALKFLPEEFAKDSKRVARFRNEVRLARQVSHPNVCRVYDLGEADEQLFLSMEYIDGEDLAAVLRRMGRPSKEKAIEIARQLCYGLAAAHDKDVLHRDLKPHNVMIDGKGRVRITDFGLAGFADQFTGKEILAGTPAYMAPEQLTGKGVSVRSDIYALGLVLYELFTGKRAREGTASQLLDQAQGSTPTSPSSIVGDIDPAVERVILRCLEDDPRDRPGSALAVASALPGGDPLAAALAAGETPSPEMVALGAEEGLLRPRTAVVLLVTLFAGMVCWFFLSDRVFLSAMVPLPKTPEQLAGQACDMLARLGFNEPYRDSEFEFEANQGYLEFLKGTDRPPLQSPQVSGNRPSVITFWYRRSPKAMWTWQDNPLILETVHLGNPPSTEPGMIGLRLDPQGRLLELNVEPGPFGERDGETASSAELVWSALFHEAGLDRSRFNEVAPIWRPSVQCDHRAAWAGTFDESSDLPVRVEAGLVQGRAVQFRVLLPWQIPEAGKMPPSRLSPVREQITLMMMFVAVMAGGAIMARRNFRLGRGDRRGALRLAAATGLVLFLGGLLYKTRLSGGFELINSILLVIALALFWAVLLWVFYMAAEPFVRRRRPQLLISWTRLLSGRWRDPLVGRDLLLGAALGLATMVAVFGLDLWLPSTFGRPFLVPQVGDISLLHKLHWVIVGMISQAIVQAAKTLFMLLLVLMIRAVVRRLWVAVAIAWLLLTLAYVSSFADNSNTLLRNFLILGLHTGVSLLILLRFGLVAATAAGLCNQAAFIPGSADLGAWQAAPMLTALVVIAAVALFGFYTSLAGRKLLRDELKTT